MIRIRLKDVPKKQKNRYNDTTYCYNKSNQSGKRSPLDDDEIQIIGTRPTTNKNIYQLAETFFFTSRSVTFETKYISCI